MIPNGDQTYPLDAVLLCAACEIAVFGWQKSTTGMDVFSSVVTPSPQSTKDRVIGHFAGSDEERRALRAAIVAEAVTKGIDLFADSLKQRVADAVRWAQRIDPVPSVVMAYRKHINRIANQTLVPLSDFGYAVSILYAYGLAHPVDVGPSQFLGTVGEVLTTQLLVTDTTDVRIAPDRQFVVGYEVAQTTAVASGPPYRTPFATENVVVFYTKHKDAAGVPLTAGDTIVVTGTVFKHRLNKKGMRETQLHYTVWHRT